MLIAIAVLPGGCGCGGGCGSGCCGGVIPGITGSGSGCGGCTISLSHPLPVNVDPFGHRGDKQICPGGQSTEQPDSLCGQLGAHSLPSGHLGSGCGSTGCGSTGCGCDAAHFGSLGSHGLDDLFVKDITMHVNIIVITKK